MIFFQQVLTSETVKFDVEEYGTLQLFELYVFSSNGVFPAVFEEELVALSWSLPSFDNLYKSGVCVCERFCVRVFLPCFV